MIALKLLLAYYEYVHKRQDGFVGAVIVVVLLLFLLALVAAAVMRAVDQGVAPIASESTNSELKPAGTGPLRGFGMTPKPGGSFTDIFKHLPETGRVVSWTGDWQELSDGGSAPYVLVKSADRYRYEPVIHVHTHTDAGRYNKVRLLRPLDSATRERYKSTAVEFCKTYKPRYFGVGVEVNRIYMSSPSEFDQFATLFNDTAKAIRDVSPDTKVFASFQLEILSGFRGGLYGDQNNDQANDWQLLEQLSEADLIAFTTYPGIIYKDPAEIPDDFYSKAAQKAGKPIVFSEVGWPSKLNVAGWQSSPGEQRRFTELFNSQTHALKPAFSVWSFLYDLPIAEPFTGMGLLEADDTARPAYLPWIKS